MQTLDYILKSCFYYPWSNNDILEICVLISGSMYPWPVAHTPQFVKSRSRVCKFEGFLGFMKKISAPKHLCYIKENKIQCTGMTQSGKIDFRWRELPGRLQEEVTL